VFPLYTKLWDGSIAMSSESFSSDQQTTVGALRAAVDQFVTERDWYQYHSPKNLAMSIAIEAAEIMEHFQWLTTQEATMLMGNAERRAEVADELADVLIYCLSFANSSNIDLSHAIGQKLARNQLRFPIERVHGRLGNE
jgi:NTP pyrophosphatase (non-canonical NTP hydrolase)